MIDTENGTAATNLDLSRRAAACRKFRWLPGMRAVGRSNLPAAWFRLEESTPSLTGEWSGALPDLTDAATLGCLLALVREAVGDPGAAVWRARVVVPGEPEYWEVTDCPAVLPRIWYGCGKTEGEALISALEGASA